MIPGLETLWPYFAGIGFSALALLWAYLKGKSAGDLRQAKRDTAAKEERLEMGREATKAEIDAASMSDADALKEAMKWAKD